MFILGRIMNPGGGYSCFLMTNSALFSVSFISILIHQVGSRVHENLVLCLENAFQNEPEISLASCCLISCRLLTISVPQGNDRSYAIELLDG